MASQTKTTTTKTTAPTQSEELQDEALNGPSKHLHLLKPAGAIRTSDRARFIAQAQTLNAVFAELETDEEAASIPPEVLDSLADLGDWMTERFSVSEAARAEVEHLPLGEYIELVFGYLGVLGESTGSSN